VWVDSLVKARQEISDEILAYNLEIVIKTNEQIIDRIHNGDTVFDKHGVKVQMPLRGRDLAVISGIKEDKARVALGQATSIVGKSESMASLANVFRKLSKDWDKLKVVATQDETEEIEDNDAQ